MTGMKEMFRKIHIKITLIIGLCFLLNSTGYLAWVYHLMTMVAPKTADALSMGAGYLAQAAGLILFALFLCRKEALADTSLYISLFLNMLFLLPAILSRSLLPTILFGLLLNLCYGWIAGYYLYRLTSATASGGLASSLGVGYSASIIASWLLSLIGYGSKTGLDYSSCILIICLILSTIIILVVQWKRAQCDTKATEGASLSQSFQFAGEKDLGQSLWILFGMIVIFSIVNSCGFNFPSAHLQNKISIEFSRLFYGAGLVIAGLVNDRNRRYGAICALAALVVPFIMLALKEEPVPVLVFWALGYFTFGFYTIYRIILFSDIATSKNILWMSGFGLLAGRIGDAAGEGLNLILSEHVTVFIVITAALFFLSVFLFFQTDQILYQPKAERQKSEEEIFNLFSARHDFTARERDVFRLILQEKSNTDIAEDLAVSDSTVKFHIHNILQKTGCKNRIVLIAHYFGNGDKNYEEKSNYKNSRNRL